MRHLHHIAPAVVLASLLAACAMDKPQAGAAGAAPQEVVVRARDFQFFEAPDTIASGLTTFRLINEGPDFHHVYLVRLEAGHTVKDLLDHLVAGGQPPAWAVDVGGPNSPMPGEEAAATVDLEPGDYAMICVIPARDGQPHVMKGMVRPLTVVAGGGAPAAAPEADIVMTLDDYSFEIRPAITPGKHTIRIENVAAQSHEVAIVKLEPGKTGEDFLRFLEKPEGMPPGKVIGGVTALARGRASLVTLDFTPGDYLLVCFLPDSKDGRPHVVHGMVEQIRVG